MLKYILLAVAVLTTAHASSCPSPSVSVLTSYTSKDASILYDIAFISQFELKCGGSPPPPSANFYAEVNGKHFNVVKNTKGTFQVSWTEEVSKAVRGDYIINIYDEETFPQVRKGRGELPKPLVSVILNHPGAYSGPWLSSEHLAAFIGFLVVYVALSSRSKLLA